MQYIICIAVCITVTLCCLVLFIRKKRRDREEAQRRLDEELTGIVQSVESCWRSKCEYLEKSLLDEDHYLAHSEMEQFLKENTDILSQLEFVSDNKAFSRFSDERGVSEFYRHLKELSQERTTHNEGFVHKELEEHQEFFDTVLSYPLDEQQRDSIVKLEDNCLVISSAGSGKTSTMIGKLLYLVRKREVKPSRILTITYTHKAAEELTQRLLGTGLECVTFHKLAMNIVRKVEGEAPAIASADLFLKVFYDLLKTEDFRESLLIYLTDYKSQMKEEHDYQNSVEYYADRRKYGIVSLYPDMDGKMVATKSEQEKKICHYLTELGARFRYEEPYEIETMTENYRQYKPDFSIYFKDADGHQRRIYLEHFGVDANGNVPQWFGSGVKGGWHEANQTYREGIYWKQQLHRNYGTTLIHTTSADFYDGSIRSKLRSQLESVGVPVNEVNRADLLDRIMARNKSLENAILQMTQSFINLVKANGRTIEEVLKGAEDAKSYRDMFVISRIMQPLWDAYHEEMKGRGEVDFTDIINKATQYCQEGKWDKRYEFILVDEFQDISIDRYRFLQSLRSDLPKTKLYCVGDDWQSIYRFTGSDMSLFAEFSKYFGYTEECRIETTYRFGNPLVQESSSFVQKNPLQKKKSVHPRLINPPETKLSFMAYRDEEHLQDLVSRMIKRVPEDKSIYIISRYSYDVKALASPERSIRYDNNSDRVTLQYGNRQVKFMTIHGSKGLEADYVFILNCNSGLYGFPSLVSDDPVLDYVLSDKEHYEYAEERRVFYVGITRAKVHTVVLYDEQRPSPFVQELNPHVATGTEACPLCGVGHRVLLYEGWTKQKTPYRVWGCDNRQAGCQFFEREFSNGQHMELTGKRYRQQ